MIWEIFQNSQENTWARVSFLKEWLWRRCFPVNFAKFLRTPFLIEHLRRLLLNITDKHSSNHSKFLEVNIIIFISCTNRVKAENKTKRKIVLQGFHMTFKWDKTPIILECLSHLENQELYLLQRENTLYYLRHFRPTSPPLTIFYCAFTEL